MARKTRRRVPSKIAEAQKSAFERREERRKEQDKKVSEQKARGKVELRPLVGDFYKEKARSRGYTNEEDIQRAATKYREEAEGVDIDGDGDIADAGSARKVAAMATTVDPQREKSPLASPSIYGKRGTERLREARAAADQQRITRLRKQGKKLIYLGPSYAPKDVGRRFADDFAQTESDAAIAAGKPIGDNVIEADRLLAWLADPKRYDDILKHIRASGLNPRSDSEIEAIWKKALERSSLAFDAGQKVTPWAAMGLMAKTVDADGRPKDRTTTQVSIDEMDPATARKMIEGAARQHLGRAPSTAEVDDFISRAQLIAKENPQVTKTTASYDFEGNLVNSVSSSTGGGQAVTDRAELAAEDLVKSEDGYAEYQAAGPLFNFLMDAIETPF